jgi:TetR/AcrR family transcriptional repressor of bet genes
VPRAESRARPGRPPSGARERLLAAALEVLKREGYAGLTTAKVAARSGENKALIGYHFGSKQGLVAAVAREVAASVTYEVLSRLEPGGTVEDLVRGALDGIWLVLDRDPGLARLYFDLAAVSVVEPDVRRVMQEMRQSWRTTASELLGNAGARDPEAGSVYLIAALDGLALERLERGETEALGRARELFVRAGAAALV